MEGSILAGKEDKPKAWSIPMLIAAQVCYLSSPGLPLTAIARCIASHEQRVWRVAHTGWPQDNLSRQGGPRVLVLLLSLVRRHKSMVLRLLVQHFSWEQQVRLKQ